MGGNLHRIIKVMERLRDDYEKPLRIEDMAQDMGMSVSGLHHNFKAVTAMSPMQFQKYHSDINELVQVKYASARHNFATITSCNIIPC